LASTFSPDNRLFVLARQGRRPPSALVAIGVVFVVTLFGLIPGQIPARMILFTPGGVPRFPAELQPVIWPILMNVSMFLTMIVGIGLWVRYAGKRPFRTLGWERSSASVPHAVRGTGVSLLMVGVIVGLSVRGGASFSPGLMPRIGVAAVGLRFLSLLSFLVQGPGEETLFRGWLLPVIGARYRPWVGVVASSILFSLAHALNSGIRVLGFVNLFLFGLFAALYALREGGLWGAGAWHGVWNWTMGDLLGFTLDGSPRVGLLRSMQAHGPDFVTGGAFGPDGGLACTAVLLTAILALVYRARDR
jgi:membrane protease YdiL (CAAX protease family)